MAALHLMMHQPQSTNELTAKNIVSLGDCAVQDDATDVRLALYVSSFCHAQPWTVCTRQVTTDGRMMIVCVVEDGLLVLRNFVQTLCTGSKYTKHLSETRWTWRGGSWRIQGECTYLSVLLQPASRGYFAQARMFDIRVYSR